MNKISAGFLYMKNTFPGISDAKIKVGIFVGPQKSVNTGRKM
jgi:hypothetical protein